MLILIGFLNMVRAQNINYSVEHFTTKEGLPDRAVYSILEHSSGYLWIGTINGVCRFDGYECVKVLLPKRDIHMVGTKGPSCIRLEELLNDKIAVFYYYDDTLDYRDVIDPYTFEITAIKKDSIASFRKKGPVMRVNTNGDHYEYIDYKGNKAIVNKVTSGYKVRLELANGRHIDISDIWKNKTAFPRIRATTFDDIFYTIDYNGFSKISVTSSPFYNYLRKDVNDWTFGTKIRAMCNINSSEVLVSTEDEGLFVLNQNDNSITPIEFTNRETGMPLNVKYMCALINVGDSVVWGIPVDGFLVQLNLLDQTFSYNHEINLIRGGFGLRHDDENIIFCGFENGLGSSIIKFNFKKGTFEVNKVGNSSNNFYLQKSKGNKYWLALGDGLFLFDMDQNIVEKAFVYENQSVKNVNNGYPTESILKGRSVLSVLEMDSLLYIGLDLGGVQVLNLKSGKIRSLIEDETSFTTSIAFIVPDNTGLWIGSYNGLFHYDLATQRLKEFTTNNGLPHNEFNRYAFNRTEDAYYFGTMNGLTSFEPSEVLLGGYKVNLLLTEARYHSTKGDNSLLVENTFEDEKKFAIPASRRNCSFDFALTDISKPLGNTFYYKLVPNGVFEKEERDWIKNGNDRTIKFDYLESGNYTLFVKGINPKGVSSEVMVLDIQVHEYFYKTWWFILLVFLVFALGIFSFLKYRFNQALNIQKLRTQLSSDLHDDVGSVLSGVAYQMELLEYSVEEEQKPLVRKIANSSRKAMSQMRDVVWAIDSRKNTCQDFIERLRDHAEELLGPVDITYLITADDQLKDKNLSQGMKHDLLLISKEFIANTIKHSKANHLEISLTAMGNRVRFVLIDNGIGVRDVETKKSGMGLSNIKLRANKLGGELTFLQDEGFGIEILLPKI